MLTKTRRTIIFAALALLLLAAAAVLIFTAAGRKEEEKYIRLPEEQVDRIFFTEEEIMTYATHIADAEYAGESVTEYGTELMFRPINEIKGSFDGADIIYVQPGEAEFVEGGLYMLFLTKHISVYYEYDRYTLFDLSVSVHDEKWAEYHRKAEEAAADSTTDAYGHEFTTAEKLHELIDFSTNIFVVTVDSVLDESAYAPTTVYNCSVVKTAKGEPSTGDILITLFNGTVEPGGEYIMLLADNGGSSRLYTLAAAEGCVHPTDSSAPELAELLESAKNYYAPGEEKSYSDLIQDELDAMGAS